MRALRQALSRMAQYPSAMAGLTIISLLLLVAVGSVIGIPYNQAVDLWRGEDNVWREHPRNARPIWSGWLSQGSLPPTIITDSREVETRETRFDGGRIVEIPLAFDFDYDGFPAEINLFLEAEYEEVRPHLSMLWTTPDGREIPLRPRRVESRSHRESISQDSHLRDWRLDGLPPEIGLFGEPRDDPSAIPAVARGRHELLLETVLFEEDAALEARLVVYGQVHGLAGTDHRRRSLLVALLWGAPVALAFGLLAAVGTTVTTLLIAAIGVWFGGFIDATIQRLTEVSMILPMLPVLVMIGTLYSSSIWLMLGVIILLGIFSAAVKVYRAMLLPLRDAPYIEAARAYGASNARIILRYMIPRVLPVLIPGFVTLIPTFVFLEASLAVLGLGDPVLPTWGKILNDAQEQSALYHGRYYWVLQPAGLLMLTGLGFAMVGFALDRIFNPRLRIM